MLLLEGLLNGACRCFRDLLQTVALRKEKQFGVRKLLCRKIVIGPWWQEQRFPRKINR